jgi:hypothetical protein
MNFLKRLASLFTGGGGGGGSNRYLTVYVLSQRCNEPLNGQVDLLNELSKPDEGEYAYYTRKVLHTTGERRCFAQVEIELYFNQDKKVAHHQVTGGRWLTADEYAAEWKRFNAPPEEEPTSDSASIAAPSTTITTTITPTTSTPTTPQQTSEESDHA